MKLLARMFLLVLTAFVLVTAAYADYSETDIAYAVTGGNIYFDASTGTVTDCDRNVTEAVIPDKIGGVAVTTIGERAFSDYDNLQSVTLPNSVTTIEDYAFGYSKNLAHVTLGSGLISIGCSAFLDCNALVEINLPNSITSIEENAFWNCSSLKSISLPNNLSTLGRMAFKKCSALTRLVIPSSVKELQYAVFSDCKGLSSVNISNGVECIGMSAFYGCDSLTSIDIPASVDNVRETAFANCQKLTSVQSYAERYVTVNGILFNRDMTNLICYPAGKTETSYRVPDSVKEVEPGAFEGCTHLVSVELNKNAAWIGEGANYSVFYKCSKLKEIRVEAGNEKYCAVDGVLFSADKTKIVRYPEGKTEDASFRIPDSVTHIGRSAFGNASLTEIVIPDGVEVISYDAFHNCANLTAIHIPNSVTTISMSAFAHCASLAEVTLPNRLESLESGLFYDCVSLKSVEIPESVTTIGSGVFEDCSALESLEIPDSVTSMGNSVFVHCSVLRTVKIGSGVKTIERTTFDSCSSLQSVTIGAGVTFIDYGAFAECSSLQNIEIPDSVTSIGDWVFRGCSGLTNLKIPNSVTSIDSGAFFYCSGLQSVTIPDSVAFIGNWAFGECDSLRDVYYGGSKAQWEAIDGIRDSKLISDRITVHYGVDAPDTPIFEAKAAPTVAGHAIGKADLTNLTEISVPVTVSAESAVIVTICVPFFDGGKFLGTGFVTATVDKTTQSVTVPVTGDVSSAGKLNVIFMDTGFCPLSATAFDIAA